MPGTTAHDGETLTDVLCRKPATGNETLLLNPRFVEWMMSFPSGWTLPNSDIVAAVSKLSATHGCQSKPASPSVNCSDSEVRDDVR